MSLVGPTEDLPFMMWLIGRCLRETMPRALSLSAGDTWAMMSDEVIARCLFSLSCGKRLPAMMSAIRCLLRLPML